MKFLNTTVAALLGLLCTACTTYPEGVERFNEEAKHNARPSLATPPPPVVPVDSQALENELASDIHPIRGYKSATTYTRPRSRLMDILPPTVMVREDARRCGAQLGNSVYDGKLSAAVDSKGRRSFFYRYFNKHREGVRGTVDWLVDGIFADKPHQLEVKIFNKPYARRTVETQFFRAFERHDICLSGKPNAMNGSRAFCDAELQEDLSGICGRIYNGGYGGADCAYRAWMVKGGVISLGGLQDLHNEIHTPYANIEAACTSYRGWTAPVDQLVKLRTGNGSVGLARLSVNQTGQLVAQFTTDGHSQTTMLALSAATRACDHSADNEHLVQRTLVTCDGGGFTLGDLQLTLRDFLVFSPVVADFDGDGRDEILLLAVAGARGPLPLGPEKRELVSLVGLPVAVGNGGVIAGRPFLLAVYEHDPYQEAGGSAGTVNRLLALLSEHPLAGSFLIDDTHRRVVGDRVVRPQQIAIAGIALDPYGSRQMLVKTVGFEMAPACADATCFRKAVLTQASLYKDGRTDDYADIDGWSKLARWTRLPAFSKLNTLTTHSELYKRLFYPQEIVHNDQDGSDQLASYFAGSGVSYHGQYVPQYMERTAIGPVRVDDVFHIDMTVAAGDNWEQQHIDVGDALKQPCQDGRRPTRTLTEDEISKVTPRQLNWFGCRDEALPGTGYSQRAYRSWSKLLYPAVRVPGTTQRFASFLTNCDVINEDRGSCDIAKPEMIRLAVIDEDRNSTITVPPTLDSLPNIDTPPDQVVLVDIHNKNWRSVDFKPEEEEDKGVHGRNMTSCSHTSGDAACTWMELPSYVGRFGHAGEAAMLFVRKISDAPVAAVGGNANLTAPKRLELLAVYKASSGWRADTYACQVEDMSGAGYLLWQSPYWVVAANAMVVPGAGSQDALMLPVTLQQAVDSGDAKARWGWVRINFDGRKDYAGDNMFQLPCAIVASSVDPNSPWDVGTRVRLKSPPSMDKDATFGVETISMKD